MLNRKFLQHSSSLQPLKLTAATFETGLELPGLLSNGLPSHGLLAILALCFSIAGCGSGADVAKADGVADAAAGGPPPALVRVADVIQDRVSPRLMVVGTVRPRHTSIVASGSDGVVEEFSVEEGDFVKTGTVLSRLRMKSTDLDLDEQRAILAEHEAMYQESQSPRPEVVEEAMARQKVAEATLANADRRLNELRELQKRNAAIPSEVEDAEDRLDEAKQNLAAAKAVHQLAAAGVRQEARLQAKARLEAQQMHVAFLESEKEKRTTLAPFDGFVVQEHTYDGQWLAKGAPVVTLAQLDEVDVHVQVDQEFIGQIHPGDDVSVRIPGTAPRQWTGRVRSIVPRTEWQEGSRSFPVIVRIANRFSEAGGTRIPELREGMMAETEFFGDEVDAVLVPKDALVRTSRGTFVFVLNPVKDNEPPSVSMIVVETGVSREELIQATADDLKPGMQVVTEGAERLRPFQAVRVLEQSNAEDSSPAKAPEGR
ncbi:MAG: efflux RND transporter periplasmic adaptor subunit [Planctomycetaceae bacterium]